MTIDLTTITTPFGLLDDETQAQLRAAKKAGMRLEYYDGLGWASYNPTYFSQTATYRLPPGQVWPKPEPKREVRYAHLLSNGSTMTLLNKCEDDQDNDPHIIARARVELVEGQFDD